MPDSTDFDSRAIVLRRFASEALEFLPSGPSVMLVSDWDDAEPQLYSVTLPPDCSVRPVDWRQVAYDHIEVRRRVMQCAVDNTADSVFEVASAQFLQELAARIQLALTDLSSVFDVVGVRCEANEALRDVQIEGEYKNGERGTIVFQIDSNRPTTP